MWGGGGSAAVSLGYPGPTRTTAGRRAPASTVAEPARPHEGPERPRDAGRRDATAGAVSPGGIRVAGLTPLPAPLPTANWNRARRAGMGADARAAPRRGTLTRPVDPSLRRSLSF